MDARHGPSYLCRLTTSTVSSVASCDHVSHFGCPVGSGLVYRLLATVLSFTPTFHRTLRQSKIPSPRVTFDSHSRILSVATLLELLFRRYRFRGRHVAASSFEFTARGVTLSSSSSLRVNPTLSELPELSSGGALSLSFPTVTSRTGEESLSPSISRETPSQAPGPFSLRPCPRVRPPHLCLVSEVTLHSFSVTAQSVTGA